MIEITKLSAVLFMRAKNLWSFDEERKGEFGKAEDGEKGCVLKLQYNLTWKLIRHVREQQSVYGRSSAKEAS